MVMNTVTIWNGLVKDDYAVIRTPKDLARQLALRVKKGTFLQNGYRVDFRVVDEDEDTFVVNSERISRGGYSAGGTYYINKKNLNKAIWD
jgi:hypothetical protein